MGLNMPHPQIDPTTFLQLLTEKEKKEKKKR